ncbi:hypothetical protein LZ31DRAFT_87873 [Colletotrichum somersetense]|nr:hypothetical protein LZ31DRAFT_87873 [Colletotrichum somersetense]
MPLLLGPILPPRTIGSEPRPCQLLYESFWYRMDGVVVAGTERMWLRLSALGASGTPLRATAFRVAGFAEGRDTGTIGRLVFSGWAVLRSCSLDMIR